MNSAPCSLSIASICLLLATTACGAGGPAVAKLPEYAPRDQVTSRAAKNPAQPLIVDWPSADRGKLEARIQRGLVVVRYSGRTMEVLDRCAVSGGSYRYQAFTKKKDRVAMRDVNDLSASFPLGAAVRLEGELRNAGELDVDMTLVGRWEGDKASVRRAELEGFCDGATHVVSAMTVGAFTFSAAANARVSGNATVLGTGAAGSSEAKRAMLNQDGDEQACAGASTTDWSPPEGCRAPIRVEVVSLAEAERVPKCQDGAKWDGSRCTSDSGALPALLLLMLGAV